MRAPPSRLLRHLSAATALFMICGCAPSADGWVEVPSDRTEICKMVRDNIHKNNLMARNTLNNPKNLPDIKEVMDLDSMPGGQIYKNTVGSLSDDDLLAKINENNLALFYLYEYSERLHKRGREMEALKLAYLGTLPNLPKKYSISEKSIKYKGVVPDIGGGFAPSDCLATEICGDFVVEKPLYWNNCQRIRSK